VTYTPTELAAALGLPEPTDEQAAVIAAPVGPLVVVAGAGAGKTETMAARVVWLVANGVAGPGPVLGLTFLYWDQGNQLLRGFASGVDDFLKLSSRGSEFVFGPLAAPAATPATPPSTMDISTILSIPLFAAIQVGMYFICLLKIAEIARQALPAATKLRLMENEENLFDGGLYIGIAGTATALVLQVLGLINANLLAAYSSNLFGIVCVALVKIRHVRPYKRQLIVEIQQPAA